MKDNVNIFSIYKLEELEEKEKAYADLELSKE